MHQVSNFNRTEYDITMLFVNVFWFFNNVFFVANTYTEPDSNYALPTGLPDVVDIKGKSIFLLVLYCFLSSQKGQVMQKHSRKDITSEASKENISIILD